MDASAAEAIGLVRHPENPGAAVAAVRAAVRRLDAARLALAFEAQGDLTAVRIPPLVGPRLVHGLWQHTCCEIFVAPDLHAGSAESFSYHEINVSPSGEWAAYAFAGYREPIAVVEALAPAITARALGDRLVVEVEIALDRLSSDLVGVPLRLAISAVLEETDGRLSYWSLRHPAGKPDFHHAEAFALRLDAPDDR